MKAIQELATLTDIKQTKVCLQNVSLQISLRTQFIVSIPATVDQDN